MSAVVIGVGNTLRGDDAAGIELARRVREEAHGSVRVVEVEGEPSRLIDAWEGADTAVVVDAAEPRGRAGEVRRLEATDAPLPAGALAASTHALDLAEVVELARALGRLPGRLIVYAIEGAGFEAGTPLSGEVAAAIEPLVPRVLADAAG